MKKYRKPGFAAGNYCSYYPCYAAVELKIIENQ